MSTYFRIGDHVFRDEDVRAAGTSKYAHPVAVIDFDDREQVERFAYTFLHGHYWSDKHQTHTDAMEAALREFANPTPPRPDEPTGLGAVVEDRWGHRFVQVEPLGGVWRNATEAQTCTWDHVAAVRVLSEGVTA